MHTLLLALGMLGTHSRPAHATLSTRSTRGAHAALDMHSGQAMLSTRRLRKERRAASSATADEVATVDALWDQLLAVQRRSRDSLDAQDREALTQGEFRGKLPGSSSAGSGPPAGPRNLFDPRRDAAGSSLGDGARGEGTRSPEGEILASFFFGF